MSHNATNWAIQQRGLKPATKLVLWHLCDRHHPDHGCFPSQETLADDCEMSRSSLNEHLKILEDRGLIRREQRIEDDTKRQKSTSYILGFEYGQAQHLEVPCPENGHGAVSGKQPKPCPENSQSRVQNPDTNSVREPVREPVAAHSDLENLSTRLVDAAEGKIHPHGAVVLASIFGLLEAGCDLETDILPSIRAQAARMTKPAIKWGYFVPAIREAYEQRISAGRGLSKPKPSTVKRDEDQSPEELRKAWSSRLDQARMSTIWKTQIWGPPPGKPGCRVPPDMLGPRDLTRDWFEERLVAA